MRFLRTITVLTTLSQRAHCNKLLIIGDSYGELSFDYFEAFCESTVVYNHAVSGSEAEDWVDGVPENVDADFDVYYDHVWFSVGGNDFLGSCNATAESIRESVSDALATVAKNVGPSTPVVMTGYCSLTPCYEWWTCDDGDDDDDDGGVFDPFSTRAVLMGGIQRACEDVPRCTFVDAYETCDYVDETGYSSGAYHSDTIHIQKDGYCKLLEMPALRSALGCVGESVECGDGNALAYCPDGAFYCVSYWCVPNLCFADNFCVPRLWVIPLIMVQLIHIILWYFLVRDNKFFLA